MSPEALPLRPGPRPRTSSGMPHAQIDVTPDPVVHRELHRRAYALPGVVDRPSVISVPGARALWLADWGFDWLYEKLFVRPYVILARRNREDFVDAIYETMARVSRAIHRLLSFTVSGNVRWYVAAIAGGAVLVVGLVVLL